MIGNRVTLFPGVIIGDGCTVMDGAVVGRPPIAAGSVNLEIGDGYQPVAVGNGSVIGCNSVLYAGVRLGEGVLVGDLTTIRELCTVADQAVIGQQVCLHWGTQVGARSRISYNCVIGGTVEEDVFIAPGVNYAEDNNIYLSRFGLATAQKASPILRRFVVVGSGATLLANIEIGEGSLIAGGAVVSRSVPPWSVVAGNPAQRVRGVPKRWVDKVLSR